MSRRSTEKRTGLLRHDRDRTAQVGHRHVARVDPADEHLPSGRVVEAGQQVEQRRLSRPGRAADGDDLAGLDGQIDPAQDVGLRSVREVDVLEAHAERSIRQLLRVRRLRQRLNSLEPREAAAGRGDRALTQVDDPADRLERPHELQQEADEEHELADRQRARDHFAPAQQEHGRDPEGGEEEQPGEVVRLDGRLAHRLVAHRLGPAEEARADVLLASERLHHLDPDHGLVRRLGQIALLRLHEP